MEKPTTEFYATEKREIGYEYCYRNNYDSKLYARARINALQLEKHKGRGNKHYNTTCRLCGKEEDLIHFIIKCKKLEKKRNGSVINNNILDPEERMKDLLYRNKDYRNTSRVVRDLWTLRRQLLKMKEDRLQEGSQVTLENGKREETDSLLNRQEEIIPNNIPPSRVENPPQSDPP